VMQTKERATRDAGDTLIETMIVMVIFTLILGIITSAIVSMMRQVDKQTGLADTLGNSRKAIEVLDGQVRFANAITTPGLVASGDDYVEFRTIQNDQTELCTQWRYHVATAALQYRTWKPPASGPATPTAWLTTALSITPVSGTPVFSFTPPPGTALPSPSPGANIPLPHQSLYVDFVTSDGAPKQSSTSQVGITGINSTLGAAANNTVCQEAGRP
jgi:type II secretory pathway pseudopilin PulG